MILLDKTVVYRDRESEPAVAIDYVARIIGDDGKPCRGFNYPWHEYGITIAHTTEWNRDPAEPNGHYHDAADGAKDPEILLFRSGHFKIELMGIDGRPDETIPICPNDELRVVVRIKPFVAHRVICVAEGDLWEYRTTPLDRSNTRTFPLPQFTREAFIADVRTRFPDYLQEYHPQLLSQRELAIA